MQRVLVAVLTLSLLGCGAESRLGADERVSVAGRALHEDGRAIAGRNAVLIKVPDAGEVLSGLTSVVGTLGLACLVPEPPPVCRRARNATTDDSGHFAFELRGKDTQGSVGQASTFNLAVRAPAREGAVAGASRTEKFVIQQAQLETPNLTLWEPQLSLSIDPVQVRVSFGALPAGATDARIEFEVAGGSLWSGPYVSGATVDARLLEDAVGKVSISTSAPRQQHQDTAFEANYGSEVLAFTGQAGAPPSRNASCTVAGASGQVMPLEPCTVTDGKFVAPLEAPLDAGCVPDAQGQGCANVRANRVLTMDLGEARRASLVVVRGTSGDLRVERSVDGVSWAAVTLDGMVGALAEGTTVRYVRLRNVADDTALPKLAEVSIW